MEDETACSEDPPPTWAPCVHPDTTSGILRTSQGYALTLTWDHTLPPPGAGRREASVCRVVSASPALVSGKCPEEPGGWQESGQLCQPPKLQRLLRWDPLAPHQEEAVNADAAHGWGRRFWSPQPQHSLQGSADLIRLIAIENRNLMISMKVQ